MRTLYFRPVLLLSFSLLFFSLPNLSRHRLDVYHTSTHYVALVRISNACLKCAACGSLKTQDAKIAKKSPSAHSRTTLSGYLFATKAYIDNRKKLLNRNISRTCSNNMVNFGPLTVEICWRVRGTPNKFQPVLRLGFVAVLTLLNGGQQNFAGCLAVSWAGAL